MARTIVEDPEKLQSSLRLMVGAMNLIGMPLNCSGGGGNQAARILLLILGFIFLAVNLGSNGYFLYLNVGFLVELYLDYSLIVGFAFSFEFLTNFILVTGVPLVFWIQLCSGRWRDVWRILVRIQQEMPELKTNGFHRSVFWACCSAISLILLDWFAFFYQYLWLRWFSPFLVARMAGMMAYDWDLQSNWIAYVAAGSRLAEIAVRALFWVLIFKAKKLFVVLEKDLESLSTASPQEDAGAELISSRLDIWWGRYDLACRLVERINDCFGLILLWMAFHGLVFGVDLLYGTMFEGSFTIGFLVPIHHFVRLYVILSVCHGLKRQVSCVRGKLGQLPLSSSPCLRVQMSNALAQMNEPIQPKITAMDILEMDYRILKMMIWPMMCLMFTHCSINYVRRYYLRPFGYVADPSGSFGIEPDPYHHVPIEDDAEMIGFMFNATFGVD